MVGETLVVTFGLGGSALWFVRIHMKPESKLTKPLIFCGKTLAFLVAIATVFYTKRRVTNT